MDVWFCSHCFCRFLRTNAATTAIIITTAAPMAMYVIVGIPLVGGRTAELGDGKVVKGGVAIGVAAGVPVGANVGDAA